MEQRFSQEVIAVLVASIIASVIDPMDDPRDTSPQPPEPSDEAHPDAQEIAARLASLLVHFEARVHALEAYGMPDPLANEYREVHSLILQTAEYQLTMSPAGGQTRQ